MKAKF